MMYLRSLATWGRESVQAVRNEGLAGLDSVWRPAYYKCLHQVERLQDPGTSIYDTDWDVLIILDACRYDLLTEVADEYDFLTPIDSIRSLDSMTPAWMERTFVPARAADMADTTYICANPFSAEKLEGDAFAALDEIWCYAWDDDHETVMPNTVTDRCINFMREQNPERLLVHYVQPHWPFIPAMNLTNDRGLRPDEFGGYNQDEVWERLRRGEVSETAVWDGYRANLRLVLDSVATLLKNMDAKRVVITSDHGNAFGEYGVYGHPMHMPLSSLRRVPYVETSATDERTRNPDPLDTTTATDGVEQQLEALGYH